MNNLIFARTKFLLPISDEIGRDQRIEDGYILIKNDKIFEVGHFTEEKANDIESKYGNHLTIIGRENSDQRFPMIEGVMLPGFVKAHGHDHESPIIGIAKDVPLTMWLDMAVNPFTRFMNNNRAMLEKHFNKSPNLITYLKARIDDIHYGITCSMVHHCNHNKYRVAEIVEANAIANTKMIVAIGGQDRNYAKDLLDIPHTIALDRLDRNYNDFKNTPNLKIVPGPDQIFSNSKEMLVALKAWANSHDTLIHIHSSEEPNTTKWFRETYGQTPIEFADSIGFLDENTIVAHQVNTTKNDLKILQKTKTKVVHNPLANTILGSGMPPIREMLEMGIDLSISTDGSGSADNQCIIGAARLAAQYQKAFHQDASLLPAQKALEMITIEPAKFLGFNAGSLEPGKDADFVILDLRRPNLIPTRKDNLVENIIWAADGSEVQYVVANGKMMKNNYQSALKDTDKILAEVQELSEMYIEDNKNKEVVFETGSQKR